MLRLTKKRSAKIGLPPGTLIHIGERKTEKVRIRILDYDEAQFEEKEAKTIEECFPFKDKPTVTWINIDGIHQVEIIEKLGSYFGLHPLLLEDILNTGQRPKMEDYGDYIFIVLKMLYLGEANNEIEAEQVSLIRGSNFVISFQEREGDVFEPVRDRIRNAKGRIRKAGADYLAYTLLDAIVDNYFIILESLGETMEETEQQLATNLTLVGVWSYGDIELIPDNHDKVVPEDLWLEAYRGYKDRSKRRGRSINHEPLEWDGLLWCGNHDVPQRISGHTSKEAYRCQSDYVQGRGPSCLDISSHYLGKPLTEAVLQKLNFTPFAEEVLIQMEVDYSYSSLEMEERKKDIARLDRRLSNLKEQLGWEGGKHDQVLLQQIEKTEHNLDELRSRPVPTQSVPEVSYNVVKDFLVGLPEKWYTYSRTLRNRLLKRLIDRVVICHHGQIVEATIYWKTGQTQVIQIRRARARGTRESRWTEGELETLKKLWPNSSRETMLRKLPGRTWKAVTHQAYNLGLRRASESSNHTPRHRWEPNEEDKARELYEAGTAINDIASNVGRSYTAVLQRSWEKSWQRPHSNERMATTELLGANQNPEVSKRFSSGLVFGGRVKGVRS